MTTPTASFVDGREKRIACSASWMIEYTEFIRTPKATANPAIGQKPCKREAA